MIISCKYCLKQEYSCPRCGHPVVVRIISEVLRDRNIVTTTLILCDSTSCQNYGVFNTLTTESITSCVCESCQEKHPNWMEEFEFEIIQFHTDEERVF